MAKASKPPGQYAVGYPTYIITARRITSGELLKYRNGLVIPQAYYGPGGSKKLL